MVTAARHRPTGLSGLGLAQVVAAISTVQFGSGLGKRMFEYTSPAGVVLLRLVFATVLLVPATRPAWRQLRGRVLGLVLGYGAVLAAMNLSFYESTARLPIGVAVTVEVLGPLVLAMASTRRWRDAPWAALAVVGVVALTDGASGGLDPVGLVLAAVAGGCWACYILLAREVGAVLPGAGGLAAACAVGSLLVVPYGLVSGGGALLRPVVLAGGLGVAVLSTALPYTLELTALRTIPARLFGVMMSLEPAMAALAGLLLLGEHLLPRQLGGLALVCVASAGAALTARGAGVPAAPAGNPADLGP